MANDMQMPTPGTGGAEQPPMTYPPGGEHFGRCLASHTCWIDWVYLYCTGTNGNAANIGTDQPGVDLSPKTER